MIDMTQDQHGQARGPGSVVRGDVPEDEAEDARTEEDKPMTRFQQAASALREAGFERAEHAQAAAAAEEPGAATIADVPAARTPMGETTASGTPVAGTPATSAAPADAQLRPGEAAGKLGDFSDLTYGNLVPDAEQFTAQWREIQFRFVDDPRGSVTEAADVVAQVTAKMEAAIQERQRAIEERQRAIAEQQRSLRGRWGDDTNAATENLRETLRMYKTFLDQLIGSRTS